VTYADSGAGSVGSDYSRTGWGSASVEVAELTHEDVRGQLTEYLDGSLDAAQAARVTTHLRQCASCAAYLATLRKTIDLLGALPTQPAPGPLRQRLLAIPDDAPAAPD
jgi:anti-sigma factor RsiW